MHHHVHVVLNSHESCAYGVSDFCDKTPQHHRHSSNSECDCECDSPPSHTHKNVYVCSGWLILDWIQAAIGWQA